jgi:adenine modification enzyme
MSAPGYRLDPQPAMFGEAPVLGFGVDDFYVEVISRDHANRIIVANHYSHTVVVGSSVHLGVFLRGGMVGVLQFGPALNPASGGNVVGDCAPNEWVELNRMWLSDIAPRNSESRALSYAMKSLRRIGPQLTWVQSFADERAGGRLGVVYQAANFLFLGEHRATFYELDGRVFHQMAMTNKGGGGRKLTVAERELQRRASEATKHTYRQFRYFYPLERRVLRRLLLTPLPYPKPASATIDLLGGDAA